MEDVNHPLYGPDRDVQKNVFVVWDALPDYVKEVFLEAFSQKAISNPGARPAELRWIEMLVRFRSDILRCQCGAEIPSKDGLPTVCGNCRRKIQVPFQLCFSGNGYSIPGVPDSRIYRCQVGTCNANEALNPVGRVLANTSNPGLLGIRNLTEQFWNAETPSGKKRKVLSQEIVPLKNGIKLFIGTETITIKENS